MIGVFVTFRYVDNSMSEPCGRLLRAHAHSLRECPGCARRLFTLNSAKCEAHEFCVWDSEDAAKAFFTEELLERLTDLYGVRAGLEFVQIATLVENVRA